MNVAPAKIEGAAVITPRVIGDERGFFLETWRADRFAAAGVGPTFVQDNHSRSSRGVLRGLHFQTPRAQGKLIRVVSGAVFDVIVDIRPASPTFKAWFGIELSAENHKMLWAPPGVAHGFLALSERVDFLYKCTEFFFAEDERAILWNDPAIAIAWPLSGIGAPTLSARDAAAPTLDEALAAAA